MMKDPLTKLFSSFTSIKFVSFFIFLVLVDYVVGYFSLVEVTFVFMFFQK